MLKRFIRNQSIFTLNILYGLSPLGVLFKLVINILYISILIYLFGPQVTAECTDTENYETAAIITPNSFAVETNTFNSMQDVFYFNLLDFFAGLNKRIPSASKIDLEACKLLFLKIGIHHDDKLFPIVKLSDLSSIMPTTMGVKDPLSNLTIYTIKYPTIQNVQVVGSQINLLYLQAMRIITDPVTSIEDKKEAWIQLINIMPGAIDFQIRNFNLFLGSINYPYRVEDFYEGSVYQRAGMSSHEGMRNLYDPYGIYFHEQANVWEDEINLCSSENLVINKHPFYNRYYNVWDEFNLERPPIFQDPLHPSNEELETARKALENAKTKIEIALKRIDSETVIKEVDPEARKVAIQEINSQMHQKKMHEANIDLVQNKIRDAQYNQMLVKTGLIVCSSAITIIVIGVGYKIYKAKYGF